MSKPPALVRNVQALVCGRAVVYYGRNILEQTESTLALQSRLFVNDPWELIAEAIARALPAGRQREIAHSFRRQAEDYFRVATNSRELAVQPVLLFYAFLNLSKAYAVAQNRLPLSGRVVHGIQCTPGPRTLISALITFNVNKNQISVFRELLDLLGGNTAIVNNSMRLGHLIPQVLPGHRLWCYASGKAERFISINYTRFFHMPGDHTEWMGLDLDREDFDKKNLQVGKILGYSNLDDFELIFRRDDFPSVQLQQRMPTRYKSSPEAALQDIIFGVRNNIWETVRVGSPYRKYYVYCCPPGDKTRDFPS